MTVATRVGTRIWLVEIVGVSELVARRMLSRRVREIRWRASSSVLIFWFAGAEEGLEREGGREVRESTLRNERKW